MSALFELSYDKKGQQEPPGSVYVKGGFDDKWRKRVFQALQQEVDFYNDVAPGIPLNIPQAYFSAKSDQPQGIVMLEDLTRRDVRFGANLAPVSVDQIADVLEALAILHATWWQRPQLETYQAWREPQRIFLKYCYRPAHWEELISCKHGEILEDVLKDARTASKSLDVLWGILDAGPRTFLHGDPHGGNIFYEKDGRPGILDWQLCFAGHYSHDMSWLIVTALDIDQRRGNERDLVSLYLSALNSRLDSQINFDDAWLKYRQNMAHAVASYGAVPRDMGESSIVERSAERVFHAARDHEVLKSLAIW
jgi:aminoglycoside/choline kinase family phosphotransferase